MAALIVFFCKCLPNFYSTFMYVSIVVLFNIHGTFYICIQSDEDYISIMSDIVSFHSKRLEHLAIHFECESYQLCIQWNVISSC